MSELTLRIAKQSKVVLILAKVARIILYVMLGLCVAAFACTYLDGEVPLLVLFGKPIYVLDITEGLAPAPARLNLVEAIVQIALAQALLYMVSALFRRIDDSRSPFTAEVVRRMKAIGVMLGVIVAIDNGYLGLVLAFVVYAFAMIFEYGGELQRQVDETL